MDSYIFRTQINALNHVQRKDIEGIRGTLRDFICGECREKPKLQNESVNDPAIVKFQPIGVIKTIFPGKRGVPRQASLAEHILSKIDLDKNLFNNPEHAIESLADFSHFWVIYNFHMNDSSYSAKVCPPRLNGAKVGVFATRSPHRVNPIGMSLVKLDRIEGSTIYFYGSDMINDTPVLDIKPFIPAYDSPISLNENAAAAASSFKSREEPEGEEEPECSSLITSVNDVKVPAWISNKKELQVIFSEKALLQTQELNILQEVIKECLQADPRSVYVKEKYLSQIYSFQIDGKHVVCKFDDKNESVTVLQIRENFNTNE